MRSLNTRPVTSTGFQPADDVVDHDMPDRISRIFADHLAIEVPPGEVDLIGTGLLDSLALVNLLVQLENEFGFAVAMDELDVEDFRTLRTIADYVVRSTA